MQIEEEKTAVDWLKETRKGYIRIAVLILLSKKPHHGYEIMKEIDERTMGFWKPTAGGIYPILQSLEKSRYVEGEWVFQKKRKRKTYRITKAGRLVLERALARENQIANSMNGLFEEFVKDVLAVPNERIRLISTPRMPTIFSVFLEESREKPEDTISVLKSRRTQIEHLIKDLQKNLAAINRRLTETKHPRKKSALGEAQI